MQDIAVLNDVLFAFEAKFPVFARALLAAVTHKIFVSHDLRAYKPFFKIGVNLPCRLRRGGTARHGPRAVFSFADGKKSDEVEKFVAFAGQLIEARFFKIHGLEEFRAFMGLEFRDLLFDLAANRDHTRTLPRGLLADFRHVRRIAAEFFFLHIGGIENGFIRQEAHVF